MAIVAAAGKEKSPSTRRCVPGLSIGLLISQPLFEDCSILCFYFHKLDAHAFVGDISDDGGRRENDPAISQLNVHPGPLRIWFCRLDEAAKTTQFARLCDNHLGRPCFSHYRRCFERKTRDSPPFRLAIRNMCSLRWSRHRLSQQP